MGKTALALGLAGHVAIDQDLPVAFFSLEMSSEQLVTRLLAMRSGVGSQALRRGKLQGKEKELTIAASKIANCKMEIFDGAACSPLTIRATCNRMAADHKQKLALVVVDYIQLMEGSNPKQERRQQLDQISRSLKLVAKDLGCPILCLSQLSRKLESRQDRRPMASDLRETGSLEQDADCILFVYRDEVYNEESPDKGTAEIIIGKQRDGALANVRLGWQAETTKFTQLPYNWMR